MKIYLTLEYRKFEENNYDFVDASGKRQTGVSKNCIFMSEDEELLRVALPKNVEIAAAMKKGQEYDVALECNLKPVVDKNGNVNNKQFYVYFQLLEVCNNPFVQDVPKKQEVKKDEKF